MTPLAPLLAAGLLAIPVATAQIYADFTVSSGTPPATTPLGTIRVELAHAKAPRPVAAFIGLATGRRPWIDITTGKLRTDPFYDGQIFHRLIHNFVIQGGDALGGLQGGPGFIQQEQFHPDLRHNRYVISMAKGTLPNSAGSQFFFTLQSAHHLDDKHAVFGTVEDPASRAILDGFRNATNFPTDRSEAGAPANDPNYDDIPTLQINLESVVISGPDYAAFDLFDPSLNLPTIRTQDIEGAYLADENTFAVTWDRAFQTQYNLYAGSSLDPLPGLAVLYRSQPAPDETLNITNVSGPRYFARVVAVDYGHVANPPADLNAAGRNITLTSRNGDTVSLDFTSPGGGTWTHSDLTTGSFNVTGAVDGTGDDESRLFQNLTQGAIFVGRIPLFQLNLDFGDPGDPADYSGPEGWASLSMILNFFNLGSGWTDGSAVTAGFPGSSPLYRSFITTP